MLNTKNVYIDIGANRTGFFCVISTTLKSVAFIKKRQNVQNVVCRNNLIFVHYSSVAYSM